ncbi:hypothetical protein Ocin01_16568 [Orchesella cincta]|uniref:DOMON domain-containing protein n=1 Tax=Orchesella cincta TaxID=48709 RepID=A0A1D2MB48_ORCCI|nr:hypothetical protein Ocin01_16568 [Orchesella cincta]
MKLINLFAFCVTTNVWLAAAQTGPLTFRNSEVLDRNTGLILDWEWDTSAQTILFTISTRSNESPYFVALGLTKKGMLQTGDDVILIGRGNDGNPYVVDMVALNSNTVVEDRNQNWQYIGSETLNSGGSRITIQRRLETCDEQDYIFNSDLIHVIWNQAQGPRPPQQFNVNLGNQSTPIYFLDPVIKNPPSQPENLQNFRLSRTYQVPAQHTSYWCTIHKLNATLRSKHHIVGFAPYFATDLGRQHVHHQIVYRCFAPLGTDPQTLFEPFVNHPGEECYIHREAQFPYNLCREPVHEWAVQGRPERFPNTVGFAIGDRSPFEYFIYETHYNNPEVRSDLVLETGVDFQYTSQLRPNEGGILLAGYGVLGQWAMPPLTTEFDVAGHCSPICTTRMFPPEGVEVVGIRLHAHLSSRRLRVKHFRFGTELPFIQNDNNYDFNYQQWRWLYNPVKVLPGDQITVQCGFDNTWKNDSSSTVSGYSTRDEMCVSWLLINKRLPHAWCMSEYPTENTLARFGIQNMTWDLELHDRVIHSATDPQNVGLTFTQLTTNVMRNWTPEQKLELENDQLYTEQYAFCPNYISAGRIHNYLSLIQQELPEGVEFPLLEGVGNEGVSDTTLTTPGRTSRRARYPREIPQYIPPTSCPAPVAPNVDRGNIGGNVDDGQMTQNMNNFGEGNWPRRFPFKRKDSVWGWGAGDQI